MSIKNLKNIFLAFIFSGMSLSAPNADVRGVRAIRNQQVGTSCIEKYLVAKNRPTVNSDCFICMMNFEVSDDVVHMSGCSHILHSKCFIMNLYNCPMCRVINNARPINARRSTNVRVVPPLVSEDAGLSPFETAPMLVRRQRREGVRVGRVVRDRREQERRDEEEERLARLAERARRDEEERLARRAEIARRGEEERLARLAEQERLDEEGRLASLEAIHTNIAILRSIDDANEEIARIRREEEARKGYDDKVKAILDEAKPFWQERERVGVQLKESRDSLFEKFQQGLKISAERELEKFRLFKKGVKPTPDAAELITLSVLRDFVSNLEGYKKAICEFKRLGGVVSPGEERDACYDHCVYNLILNNRMRVEEVGINDLPV